MLTEPPPKNKALRASFNKSDLVRTLSLPKDDRLQVLTSTIEKALASGQTKAVQRACAQFVGAAAEFYKVECPKIRILGARPRHVLEVGDIRIAAAELFGDYQPGKNVIRVWMRTAVHNTTTSFGTFFSTLCHEFCHHLDLERFRFIGSPHTRGFFGRTAALYHHSRGTPRKPLFWRALPNGTYRIDWQRVNKSRRMPSLEQAERRSVGAGPGDRT